MSSREICLVLCLCLSLILHPCATIKCYEGKQRGAALEGSLFKTSCPQGTKSCQYTWTYDILKEFSCGNGEDSEILLKFGEHKETYFCNWELCNSGGVATGRNADKVAALVAAVLLSLLAL